MRSLQGTYTLVLVAEAFLQKADETKKEMPNCLQAEYASMQSQQSAWLRGDNEDSKDYEDEFDHGVSRETDEYEEYDEQAPDNERAMNDSDAGGGTMTKQ